MRKVLLLALLTLCLNIESAGVDRTKDAVYLALRDSVHHSFNDGDCDRFFHAVSKLEITYLVRTTCTSITPSGVMKSSSS